MEHCVVCQTQMCKKYATTFWCPGCEAMFSINQSLGIWTLHHNYRTHYVDYYLGAKVTTIRSTPDQVYAYQEYPGFLRPAEAKRQIRLKLFG